ncbi:replication endonuclease [Aliarcobacter butzleri]|uniref:Replication endonuclease n=1 Tax=Aliarcobacter butzleri TaxID=28197 RepID=A0AAW6VND2_9BACT|nr:replication endonuclease [Aliarcobacter butzleri]MDK2061816.1 replication endonuclease [Aliarcobacter butzleri]
MDYTEDYINSCIIGDKKEKICSSYEQNFSSLSPLTTYKKVVDKRHKNKIYGLSESDYLEVQEKIRKQNCFLEYNYIYDKISSSHISLKDLVISANHNPDRYYALIQNRINTLTNEAKGNGLEAIFITLTLPSEFHKMKMDKQTNTLIKNPKYNDISPKEAVKYLTKMYSRLRHDRSLKELTKDERIYFRVNEPHKDGTPHTHILLFIPKSNVNRVVTAFKRLFDNKANDIQTDIKNATSYIMKYINKTLPLSKQENLSKKEKYLNAWYSKHRIVRFNCSKTLAPLSLYRLLHDKFNLKELTTLIKKKSLAIFVLQTNRNKIMEIFFGDELIYQRSENYTLKNGLLDF